MDMDGWRDILHFDFHGEHVLFSSLRLSSPFTFLIASLLTILLCVAEKYLTYLLSSKWNPLPPPHSRLGNAAFRTSIYWFLTLFRLLYMLLAMTFHVGLILVVVTTLSAGQFLIEYLETSQPRLDPQLEDVPLLGRRGLTSDAEYLDSPPDGATARPLARANHPSRRQSVPNGVRAAADGDSNGTTIFTIDEGEEAA